MSDPIESFFGPARRLALSAKERGDTWSQLENRVRAGAPSRLHGDMQRHETLFKAGKTLQLSQEEKNQGLAALRAHMARTPVHAGAGGWNWLRTLSSAVAGLATVTAAFGTVAMAAEGAAPGDVLYPIKVAVNDPVVAIYVRGSAGSEAAEEVLLARRVQEVRTLARRGDRPTAVAHLRGTERAAEAIAKHRPEARVLALRTDMQHTLDDDVIAAASIAVANTDEDEARAMDTMLPFAMDTDGQDATAPRGPSNQGLKEQERAQAMKAEHAPQPMALPAPTLPEDAGDNAEFSLRMHADTPPGDITPTTATFILQPAEDALPEGMMLRKALPPIEPLSTGSGSAGSGTAASGGLLEE